MDISFFDETSAVKMVLALTKYRYIDLTFGRFALARLTLLPYTSKKSGYILSPIICRNNGNSIDYIHSPVEFNEAIRQNLIERHENLFGIYPRDDRFIFIIKNPKKIVLADDSFSYKGPFEIVGSDELIKLAYALGVGGDNTKGYGMLSPELYFWKRRKTEAKDISEARHPVKCCGVEA